MTVNSIHYIYFIVPVFLLYYTIKKNWWQNIILAMASMIFLLISDLRMSWCVVALTFLAYILGLAIEQSERVFIKKAWLTLGISSSIGTLVYFKYLGFFVKSIAYMLEPWGFNCDTLNIILPLGVSFYVFRVVSYLMDVYRKEISASHNPCNVFLYTCFFPTYISGPIDRAVTFFPQLYKTKSFDYSLSVEGCRQILWGMFKKIVIADNLAIQVNGVWQDLSIQSSGNLVLVAVLYFFQLYMDFSGYSDMAVGVGKLFGFRVTQNFHYPFFSRNISEFWRRWHMSLNDWFVRYLYIPLGGNRSGKKRTIINTLIVFTLCGFWHGSTLNFAIWGLFNGLLFIPIILMGTSHKYKNSIAGANTLFPSLDEIVLILSTFILCTIGFIIFRAPDISSVCDYCNYFMHNWNFNSTKIWDNYANICLLTISIEWFTRKREFPLSELNYKYSRYFNPILYILMVEMILHYGALINSNFIYAKF